MIFAVFFCPISRQNANNGVRILAKKTEYRKVVEKNLYQFLRGFTGRELGEACGFSMTTGCSRLRNPMKLTIEELLQIQEWDGKSEASVQRIFEREE